MAGSFGNYAENATLDHITGKSSWTKPTMYVALSTADPTDDASGIAEPSGNNYSRITTSAASWNGASAGSISTATDLESAVASGSWGTITHIALYDAATDGNMLAHGSLDAGVAISADQKFVIGAGNLTLTLS